MRPTALILAALGAAPLAVAQPYNYTINQPASTLGYSISFSAPFQTTPGGSSYIIGTAAGADGIPGNADDIASPPGSRTVPGIAGGNTAANTIVNLNSGSISASGSSGPTAYHPSGSFLVNFDVAGATCQVSNLSADLLGGGTASLAANAAVNYSTFRTREPSCTIFSLGTINIPVGNISATSITAAQTAPSTAGTMTPVIGQPGRHNFSANVDALITVTATLSGAPAPIDPQPVTLALAGTVDFNLPGAPVAATVTVNQTQNIPGPFLLDPLSFNEPLCNGPLLIKLTLASTSTTIGVNASLTASGTPSSCGPADLGRQGGIPGADGALDNNDFVVFIDYFFNNNPLADHGRQGGLPGADGQFNNNDFVVFIDEFFAGC
ncbi:MAG TPA: GC-type dockerin domain-anchored protein [Phycisphaerales bacterium]|nr:GC-type dockerin domain-anchored protein [Phycisphaerales bacterium]